MPPVRWRDKPATTIAPETEVLSNLIPEIWQPYRGKFIVFSNITDWSIFLMFRPLFSIT